MIENANLVLKMLKDFAITSGSKVENSAEG